jgi:large-conductance mechanosensitive channel
MSSKNEKDYLGLAIGVILAAIYHYIIVVVVDVLWPIVKWICKRLYAFFKKMLTRKKSPQIKVELPTPDVFKGYKNLAKAKEFKY